MAYDPASIEPRWQRYWDEHHTFRTAEDPGASPSTTCSTCSPTRPAQGLHVGHPEGYTATDIIARYKRMRGFNVLHPMGWDAFGLPAENYADQDRHPSRRDHAPQHRRPSSASSRCSASATTGTARSRPSTPSYYKWTQWIFTLLHEQGLAYEAEVAVNWCPALGTVLANEEVIDGRQRGRRPPGRCAGR